MGLHRKRDAKVSREARPVVVKVHRVQGVDEAVMFEELGADIIGVALAPEHGGGLFNDNRALRPGAVEDIARALSHSRLAIALPEPVGQISDEVKELTVRCSASYIEIPAFDLLGPRSCRFFEREGIDLIVSRIDVDPDDDPDWLLSPVSELENHNVAFIVMELLAHQEGAWNFLTEESPGFPDELQLQDINRLSQESPLLISIDASPENASTILEAMPAIRGFALTLGTLTSGRYDVHVQEVEHAAAILRSIREEAKNTV